MLKLRKITLFATVLIMMAAALINAPKLKAHANSAQTHWYGTTAYGLSFTGENCPLTVLGEKLTFDINEFPEIYYGEDIAEKLAKYNASVTAEYNFYNPEDYAVTATLAFPFGERSDYFLYFGEDETANRLKDTETGKYGITVNGNRAEFVLRHTFKAAYENFSAYGDLKKLSSEYLADEFYRPDLPVTVYNYRAEGLDPNNYSAVAAFAHRPKENSKLAFNASIFRSFKNYVQAGEWVSKDNTLTVYCFGEAVDPALGWKTYADGSLKKETGGSVVYLPEKTARMTFEEFAFLNYDEDGEVSRTDWYNAFLCFIKNAEMIDTVLPEPTGLILTDPADKNRYDLLRWFEYEITVPAKSEVINTVTAPLYPSINAAYTPPIYAYEYLLSPASTWAEFGNLEIYINTPFYINGTPSLGKFQRTDTGYRFTSRGLPEGELSFKLCKEEFPVRTMYGYGSKAPLIAVLLAVIILSLIFVITRAAVIIAAILILVIRKKGKRRNRPTN